MNWIIQTHYTITSLLKSQLQKSIHLNGILTILILMNILEILLEENKCHIPYLEMAM